MKAVFYIIAASVCIQAPIALAQDVGGGLQSLQQDADSLGQQLRDEWRLNREKLAEIKAHPGADPVSQRSAQAAENQRYQAKVAELSAKQQVAENRIAEKLEQRWQEVDRGWKAEVNRFDEANAKIENDYPPPAERTPAQREQCNQRLEAENAVYRERSATACAKRDAIHQDFMGEVNRQVKGGNAEGASRPLETTSGTKAGSMIADLDGGAGPRTVAKAEKLMNKMKIPSKRLGGVLESQGNFNFTINTEGAMGPVGSSAHQAQVEVNAIHKETYLSETAKLGPELKADIACLDHTKKTVAGRTATPSELVGKSELGQSMVKGTLKSAVDSKLPAQDIQAIMDLHGIEGTPETFLEKLGNIKARNLEIKTTAEAKQLQAAAEDLLAATRENAKRGAEKQLAVNEESVTQLEAQAEDRVRDAQKMRETNKPEVEAKAKQLEAEAKVKLREAARIRAQNKDYLAKREASVRALEEHLKLAPETATYNSGELGEIASGGKPVKTKPGTTSARAKTAGPAEPAETVPSGGSSVIDAAGVGLLIYGLYDGYQRACLETSEARIPESQDGKGTSEAFMTALALSRTGAIAMRTVWNGLGFADAKVMGEEAGKEVYEKYQTDILEGKVDKNDVAAWCKMKVKAVGLGVFRFGKAMTYDAVVHSATEALNAQQELVGAGVDLYSMAKGAANEEVNSQFRSEMIYQDLKQRGVSESTARLAADEAAQDNYWRARELRKLIDARNAREAQAGRPSLASSAPAKAPAPSVVQAQPEPAQSSLGKQPVVVSAKPAVPPVKRNEVPLPPRATPPAATPTLAKKPDSIAPRPNKLPALTLPAEVVYGTSLPITSYAGTSPDYKSAGKWTSNSADEKLYQEQLAAWQKEEDRRRDASLAAAKKKEEQDLAFDNEDLKLWQNQENRSRRARGEPEVTALEKDAYFKLLRARPDHGRTIIFSRLNEGLSDTLPANEKPTLGASEPPKSKPDGRRYFFKATPDLRFEPVEATSGTTKVTFTRLGRVSIWMEIVDRDGKVVGETAGAEVNVVPPKFALVLQPASDAKVGQEVVATIETTPPIPADLLDYRWLEPPTANRLEKTPNASQIVFKATAKPVTLQALARVPHYGDALGEVRETCSASAYILAVTPVRRGPIPKEWATEARGLVDVNRTFLVDEQFSLRAEIQGQAAPKDLRWRWTVNGGTTLSNPSVSEPTVSRHEPGEVSASVEALDSSGNLLGQAQISVRVVSEDEFIKPLAVLIKLDVPSVQVGRKAVARAEVTGGRPPYVLEWNPAGSGMQLELSPKEEGSQNITVTVRDKRKKEARASATLKVEALPLVASVKPDHLRALCSENVTLTASASGGTKPYRFRWTTPARGQGEQGSLTSLKAGSIGAGVDVTDAKGRTAQARTTVNFDPLSLTITGLQPKEKPGSTRTAKAGENLPQGITVKFRTSPSLPITASGKSAQIRFDKPGQYEVQATAYATVDGIEQEVVKAPPVKVEVEAEPLQLVLEPTEISVGAEASARLVNPSGLPPKDVRADWTFAAGTGETVSGTSAKLRPDAPGSFAVSVQWKDAASGKVTGQAKVTLNVKPLNLEIVVDPAGGEEFVIRVSPRVTIPSGVAVNWTAAGADFVGPKQGSSIRVRISSGGKNASVTATASNARRIEVGRATASFDGPEKPDPSQLAQKHIEKGYQEEQAGRLESACTEYEQAIKLAPDPRVSSRLDALRQKIALAREETDRAAKTNELLGTGFRKESAGDLEGALADYEAAQKLTADARIDAHMRELRDKIAQARTKQATAPQTGASSQDKTDKAQVFLNEAFKKESAGDLSGAHDYYMKALALKFDKRVWERVDALEKRIENATAKAEQTPERSKARQEATPLQKTAQAPPSSSTPLNPAIKKPAVTNPLIAQKKTEVLRLANEALAIGNSMKSGNVNLATAQRNLDRAKQIQSQILRLNAEINSMEAGR